MDRYRSDCNPHDFINRSLFEGGIPIDMNSRFYVAGDRVLLSAFIRKVGIIDHTKGDNAIMVERWQDRWVAKDSSAMNATFKCFYLPKDWHEAVDHIMEKTISFEHSVGRIKNSTLWLSGEIYTKEDIARIGEAIAMLDKVMEERIVTHQVVIGGEVFTQEKLTKILSLCD